MSGTCAADAFMAYFPDDHTSEMLAQGLTNMLSAWDLAEENLVAITTNNGTNIAKAAELNGWTWVQCFGHSITHIMLQCLVINEDICVVTILYANVKHTTHI